MFARGGIGPRTAAASTIVLCTDVKGVTAADIRTFAARLYPDRQPPDVLQGSAPVANGGFVVYAYLGGKMPNAELRRCAEAFPKGKSGTETAEAIEQAHTRLGTNDELGLLPKNYPFKHSGFRTVGAFRYGDGWSLIAFVSLLDEPGTRKEFLRALFGLTVQFCRLHCDELLSNAVP